MSNNPNNKVMLQTHLNNFLCHMGKAVKYHFRLMEIDYKKVLRVIESCQCNEHLDVANRLITCFYMKHSNDFYLEKLEKQFIKKRLEI